jgi:ATP/maltotriose-dependent transcriptional regulator MalT
MNEIIDYFLENCDKPYFVINQDNQFITCNAAFEKYFATTKEFMLGKNLSSMEVISNLDFEMIGEMRVNDKSLYQVKRSSINKDELESTSIFAIQRTTLDAFDQTPRIKAKFPMANLHVQDLRSTMDAELSFTKRELEVLRLLGEGLSVKQIAQNLKISSHTVGDYMKSIYTKLKVKNRVTAILAAQRIGLI